MTIVKKLKKVAEVEREKLARKNTHTAAEVERYKMLTHLLRKDA